MRTELLIMEANIEEFRKYLEEEVSFHKSGEMQSIAESIHGEHISNAHLAKFYELFPKEGDNG